MIRDAIGQYPGYHATALGKRGGYEYLIRSKLDTETEPRKKDRKAAKEVLGRFGMPTI